MRCGGEVCGGEVGVRCRGEVWVRCGGEGEVWG